MKVPDPLSVLFGLFDTDINILVGANGLEQIVPTMAANTAGKAVISRGNTRPNLALLLKQAWLSHALYATQWHIHDYSN